MIHAGKLSAPGAWLAQLYTMVPVIAVVSRELHAFVCSPGVTPQDRAKALLSTLGFAEALKACFHFRDFQQHTAAMVLSLVDTYVMGDCADIVWNVTYAMFLAAQHQQLELCKALLEKYSAHVHPAIVAAMQGGSPAAKVITRVAVDTYRDSLRWAAAVHDNDNDPITALNNESVRSACMELAFKEYLHGSSPGWKTDLVMYFAYDGYVDGMRYMVALEGDWCFGVRQPAQIWYGFPVVKDVLISALAGRQVAVCEYLLESGMCVIDTDSMAVVREFFVLIGDYVMLAWMDSKNL